MHTHILYINIIWPSIWCVYIHVYIYIYNQYLHLAFKFLWWIQIASENSRTKPHQQCWKQCLVMSRHFYTGWWDSYQGLSQSQNKNGHCKSLSSSISQHVWIVFTTIYIYIYIHVVHSYHFHRKERGPLGMVFPYQSLQWGRTVRSF